MSVLRREPICETTNRLRRAPGAHHRHGRARRGRARLTALVLLGALSLLAARAEAQSVTVTAALSTSSTTVQESAGDIAVTATLSGGSLTVDVPVNVGEAAAETATKTVDYVNRSGWTPFVTIKAGATTATGTIGIINDTRHEQDETIIWEISGQSSGGLTITIKDDDPLAYAVSSATALEGGTARLTVTLSGSDDSKAPAGGGKFTITPNYGTGSGKAAAADVGTVPQTVTFDSDATTATFSIPIARDRLDENDETFTVTVAPGDGFTGTWTPATTGANIATVTITDAETLSFASTTATATEGEAAALTVTRSGSTEGSVVFQVTPSVEAGNSAQAADLAAAASGTIAAGASSTTVSLSSAEDDEDEDAETFTATITTNDAGYAGGDPLTFTIRDDDTAGVMLAGTMTPTVREGSAADASYTVVLRSRPTANVIINATSGDSAKAATSPASLTFDASSDRDWKTAKTFTVTGGAVTGEDTAQVIISHAAASTDPKYPAGLSIADVTVTVTPLVYSLSPTSVSVDEGDAAALTVTLNQAAPADFQFSVTPTYETGAGKAAAADLVGSYPRTLNISQGSTSASLSIRIARDAAEEDNETFTVGIATTSPNWEKKPAGADSATVTIQDTTETMRFAIRYVAVNEGAAATLTATRTGSTGRAVPFSVNMHADTVRFLPEGSRRVGRRLTSTDVFSALTVSGTIASGAASATVSLQTVEDAIVETTATYLAVLDAEASTGYRVEGATDFSTGVARIQVVDDDMAGATMDPPSLSMQRYQQRTYTVALTSQPTAAVTIAATSSDATKATVSPASVSFGTSATDWSTSKTFTVNGAGAGSARISHKAVSTDPGYPADLSLPAVAVTVNLPVPTGLTMTPSAYRGNAVLLVSHDPPPGPPPASVPAHKVRLQVVDLNAPAYNDLDQAFPGYGLEHQQNVVISGLFSVTGDNSYRLGPLQRGHEYAARAHLVDTSSDPHRAVRARSSTVRATAWTVPGAPTGVTVTAADGALEVGWTAPSSAGGTGAAITGYVVEYRQTGDPPGTWNDSGHSGTGTTGTVSGLTNGTTYQVRVHAKNGIEPGSTWSASTSGTPAAAGPRPRGLAAEAGSLVLAGLGTVPQLEIRWTAPQTGYRVIPQVKLSTVQDWPEPAATPSIPGGLSRQSSTATSAAYVGPAAGATYDVRAHLIDTNDDDSVVANSSTRPVQVTFPNVPDAPDFVTVSPRPQGLDVTWTVPASDGGEPITGYRVRWRVQDTNADQMGNQPGAWNDSFGVAAGGTSYRITGLTNGTTYDVEVRGGERCRRRLQLERRRGYAGGTVHLEPAGGDSGRQRGSRRVHHHRHLERPGARGRGRGNAGNAFDRLCHRRGWEGLPAAAHLYHRRRPVEGDRGGGHRVGYGGRGEREGGARRPDLAQSRRQLRRVVHQEYPLRRYAHVADAGRRSRGAGGGRGNGHADGNPEYPGARGRHDGVAFRYGHGDGDGNRCRLHPVLGDHSDRRGRDGRYGQHHHHRRRGGRRRRDDRDRRHQHQSGADREHPHRHHYGQ